VIKQRFAVQSFINIRLIFNAPSHRCSFLPYFLFPRVPSLPSWSSFIYRSRIFSRSDDESLWRNNASGLCQRRHLCAFELGIIINIISSSSSRLIRFKTSSSCRQTEVSL